MSNTTVAETLMDLMALPGPTGQEEPVLAWCRERWAAMGGTVRAEPIGNVTALFGGNGPRLLLQGHADEIGFVVKSIDARGFIWLTDAQTGLRTFQFRYPVGHPALIVGPGVRVPGVFASATGHILATRPEEKNRLEFNDVFVDVGMESREEVLALGVEVGMGVIWNPEPRRIGRRIVGKAIDDRVALALMTHALEGIDRANLAYDVTLAATVQEEIGLIGAESLGVRGAYDLAIAIDNGPIADYPGTDEREMPVRLGQGPTLVYKDSWTHYDRRVIGMLKSVAEANGIPYQQSIFPGFGSDGAALIRAGIPAALLGIATRYTHAPFEMTDERDLDAALNLLTAFLTTPASPLPLGPS